MIWECVALYLYTRIQFAMQACTKTAFMATNPHPYMHGLQKYTPVGVCFFMCLEYLFLTGCVPPMENLGIWQGMNR